MFSNRLPLFLGAICLLQAGSISLAKAATVLVLQFHNSSKFPDLNWVGESISETLKDELSGQDQIVFGRESRTKALDRLSLRPGADFTKATLIRLGQSLDADYVYYGTYDASQSPGSSELKNSSLQVSAHVIDLRKMQEGPDVAEAGKLADLSRIEEHLAWQALRFIDPAKNRPFDQFLGPGKLTRVDAEESYVRGLLSANKDQQQRWFMQALALDPKFTNPAYELGKISLERKDFRQAISWFGRVPATNPRYSEAHFKMGLAAYQAGAYGESANYFREIVKTFPLNEVYNNLGAAEDEANEPNATDDLRHALEGDVNDSVYLFNLGDLQLKHNNFDDAEKRFQAVLSHDPDDTEAQTLLGRAQRHEFSASGSKPPAPYRLKTDFELTAFRQLKAVVQTRSSP